MAVQDRARVGGSGFTVLLWDSAIVGFAQQLTEQSAQPVGPGATPIHPLDEPYAVEIITPAAAGVGTLTLRLYERYTIKAWERLGVSKTGADTPNSLAGTVDIVDIFITIAESATPLTITKVVRPPKIGGDTVDPYIEQYHGCVVSAVQDNETIEVGTMQVLKDLTVQYRYKTKPGKGGLGFAMRNRQIKPVNSTG